MSEIPLHGTDRLETPERVELEIDLAGLGSRALAVLLDALIIGAVGLVGGAVLALSISVTGRWGFIALVVFAFFLYWLYFAAFEALWDGQTPGKRALGIRVRRLGGYPIGWAEALIRNFLRVAVDFFAFLPVGAVAMILTRRCQRIGDLAAGTIVVREGVGGSEVLDRIGYGAAEPAMGSGGGTLELTQREYETLHDFMTRREQLEPEARTRIADALAAGLRRRFAGCLELPPSWEGLHDEIFLERLEQAHRGLRRIPGSQGRT